MSNDLSAQSLTRLLPAGRDFIPTFNGLRALSILVVLIDHAIPWKIIPGGFGVSVFFLISGFLITRLLIDEYRSNSGIDLIRFYQFRAIRLFPALVVALIYALAATYCLGFQQSIIAIFSVVFYFANYVHAIDNTLLSTIAFDPAWSLSVEEHFYFAVPAIMIWALKGRNRAIYVMVGAILIAAAFRIVYHFTLGDLSSSYIFSATETRMDFIAYGCLAALVCDSSNSQKFISFVSRPYVFCTGIFLIAISLGVRAHFFRDTFRYYFQGWALFIIIPAVVFGPGYERIRLLLNTPALDWIGRLSYSLYLFHFPSLVLGAAFASTLFPGGGMGRLVLGIGLGLALSFLLASLSYYWIEQPCLRFRRRLGRPGADAAAKMQLAPPRSEALGG